MALARKSVLRWFGPRRSAYPWRRTRDPFRILVSEVMLQQTQAVRVIPAYTSFVQRFPTIGALSLATRRDVVIAWGSLGYNRRAVALREAARVIAHDHGGRVPRDPAALVRLPGVGPYTAAAVSSIAFAVPVPAIDTNVRRIVARAFLGVDPPDATAREIDHLAGAWVDPDDPGTWNQALMDLGREVCRPQPRCPQCPLRYDCRFARQHQTPTPRRPIPRTARSSPFQGSTRQARGAVLRVLRVQPECTLDGLVRTTGLPLTRLVAAVDGLAHDGLVATEPAAQAGRPGGRVRLAD